MKKLWIYCMLLLTVIACEDPYKDSTYQIYDVNPISTYLDSKPEQFSQWVDILHHADLYNALNQSNMLFTAFIPTNEAVQAFLKKEGYSSVDAMDTEYARQLVKYHIINGGISQDIFLEGGKLDKPNMLDDYLLVTVKETGGINGITINDEATIVELAVDSMVSNGYVYVINSVMNPPVETIYERLCKEPSYSVMKEIVDASGWKERLNTPYDTVEASGYKILNKKNFTFLAVTNETFAKDGITNVQTLINALKNNNAKYTTDEAELNKYVGYHMWSGYVYEDELMKTLETDTLTTINSSAENEVFQVKRTAGDEYLIGFDCVKGTFAKFVEGKTNMRVKNGAIHEIDYFLPVAEPERSTVIWELTDYDEIATYVSQQGGEYRPPVETEKGQQIELPLSQLPSFRYEVTSKKYTGGTLAYYTAGKSDGDWQAKSLNNDCLLVSVGQMGWVQMPTPVLLKGKYKVEMQFWYDAKKQYEMRANCAIKVLFDGKHANEPGSPILAEHPKDKKEWHVYTMTLYDEVEFTETKSHLFKLVTITSQASSKAGYYFLLDYIKFIPIND